LAGKVSAEMRGTAQGRINAQAKLAVDLIA
jgi:hypothetical protein